MALSVIDSTGLSNPFGAPATGNVMASWTTSARPASPTTGQYGYNTTYGGVEVYNGSAWDTITGGPAFQVNIGSAQTISSTTFTKLQYNTVVFDTNSNFSTSNYRFTPTIAGYYQLNTYCQVNTTPTRVINAFVQNGSTYYYGADSGNSNVYSSMNSMVLKFNGSTDYVEVFIYLSSGQNTGSGATATHFSGSFIRSI
jgi:hypothetical protein